MSNKEISDKDVTKIEKDLRILIEQIKNKKNTIGEIISEKGKYNLANDIERILAEQEQDKKRMQELEEENAILRKANNITKNIAKEVKIKDITQVMNKSFEEYMKDYISKQKIKDVLQNNRNELFTITYVSKEQYEPYKKQIDRINKIEQELLEGEE